MVERMQERMDIHENITSVEEPVGSLRWAGFSEERAKKDSFRADHKVLNLALYRLLAAGGERPRADSEGNQEGDGC